MSASPHLLDLAERAGAYLTGKPDGSEPITVVFTPAAWQAFDASVDDIRREYLSVYADAVLYAGLQIWASIQRHEGDPCWEWKSWHPKGEVRT